MKGVIVISKKTAICPGSFDPIILGHLDIINRASELFDEVIVLVLPNSNKNHSWFSLHERVRLIEKVIKKPNIRVECYENGLLVNYAKQHNATAIVKGLRAVTDFDYEFQMALTNKTLDSNIETIFIPTNTEYMFLSSTVVKEVAKHKGDISSYIPKEIENSIKEHAEKFST